MNCEKDFAGYYCEVCAGWDDDTALKNDVFHCDKCRACM